VCALQNPEHTQAKRSWFFRLLPILLIVLSGCASAPLSRTDWNLQGDLYAHDPTLIRQDGIWYAFYTGRGIKVKRSEDGITWTHYGQVFKNTPEWAKDRVPNASSSIWAPDIFHYKGKFYLFYSVSSFGRNTSVIGLAVNETLDKKDSDYEWQDLGLVIESRPGDPYNCIDPNFVLDKKGKPWLAFGSFWSGIKLAPLDSQPPVLKEGAEMKSLAFRPGSNAVEAPYIIYRKGFYYLFVSFDSCCRGVESTYKIAVGRSREITGPYVDTRGRRLLDGGGSIIKRGDPRWKGPGHNGVYTEKGESIIYYHAYDALNSGNPTLRIQNILWNKEGWPELE